MTYSKLFSGNLPELTHEIIQYFRNDFSTLYSCILVNRLWCRLAIPLLWEDPFSTRIENFQFIEIYLHNSNEDDKAKLNEYGINNNLLLPSTLFNYPSFIKRLNTHEVGYSIAIWLSTFLDHFNNRQMAAILIYRLLFKMFIENEGNLHSFEVKVHKVYDYKYFNDTMELILQNPSFTCNIKDLMLYISISRFRRLFPSKNVLPLLKFLYSNCTLISSFHFGFSNLEADNFSIGKCLSQMIITQQNLKKLSFEYNNFLYNLFSSLKNPNLSNTLKIITFHSIDFNKIITNFQEIFNQLNVLESIHIIFCQSLNSEFVQQLISITKPFKLKSLIMDEVLHVKSFQLLVKKFGNDLENFGFGYYENNGHGHKKYKKLLLKSIVKYCTKIKLFDLAEPDNIYIYLTFNLIKNINQSLNYLNIEFDSYKYYTSCNEICSIILKNLGQVLPSKLEFLKLCLKIKSSDMKIFLENSQNTFIKRLLIRNIVQKGDNILPHIKKYIMKKQRVKYLAIYNGYEELASLDDEVNEFKLHDIKIQKYDDFHIHFLNNYRCFNYL